MRRLAAVGLGLVGVENPEWHFAADTATAAALGATVDAHSSAARRRVDLVNRITRRIIYDERWHATVARFDNITKLAATRGKGGSLVAAAFAGTHGTADAWAINCEQLSPESRSNEEICVRTCTIN